MADIDIIIKTTAELGPVEKAIEDMKELGKTIEGRGRELEQPKVAAFAAVDAFKKTGTSARELSNDFKQLGQAAEHTGKNGITSMTVAVGAFVGGAAVELARKLPEIIEQLYRTGVESLRAKQGFEAMGGSADAIAKMQAATHGLADDTDLMAAGTLALSAGVVKSTADLTELARIGATLGVTFKGSAKEGINAFTTALDSVGNVRALRTLGIDTLAVKDRFEELKKTMTDQEA
jgi:hypothetical protein